MIWFAERPDAPASARLVRFALDTSTETELKKGEWILSVSVSPDSRQLAYLRAEPTGPVTHLMVMPAEGGEPREVLQDSNWDGNARFKCVVLDAGPEVPDPGARSAIETSPSEVWALENFLPKAAGRASR